MAVQFFPTNNRPANVGNKGKCVQFKRSVSIRQGGAVERFTVTRAPTQGTPGVEPASRDTLAEAEAAQAKQDAREKAVESAVKAKKRSRANMIKNPRAAEKARQREMRAAVAKRQRPGR